MELKTGDKVKFLNDFGGGIVVRITDAKQAIVQIEDGFEIPVLISELIKTESSGEKETRSVTTERKVVQSPAPQKPKVEASVEIKTESEISAIRKKELVKPLFAIVPLTEKLDAENANFDLFLLNDGNFYFYYTFGLEKFGRTKLIEKGELEPEMKVKLGTYDFNELTSVQSINIDLLVYAENDYKYHPPIPYKFELKSFNLLRSVNYTENDFFYESAYIADLAVNYALQDVNMKKVLAQKEKIADTQRKTEVKNPDIEEVDLHIESIVDDHSKMSNGEIITTQMARFTTSLEGAINGKTKKIVFIHGVGNGKLRYELRKTLENKYSNLQFQDASYAEYGFGATLVILRR
jgi:hypothetical protein